jgi:hypothetical protein
VIGPEKLRAGKVELFDRAARKAEVVDFDAVVSTLAGKMQIS